MLQDWLFNRHLEDDEELVLVVHKHWFIGLKFLFWPVAVFIVLIGLLAFAFSLPVFYVVAALGIFTVVWGIRNFLDYYLDAWLLTESAIIDIEWHGWFHRTSSRVLYSDIQVVSYEIDGICGTLLRFGTIGVEKISTGNEIVLEYVSRPRSVEAHILQQMENYMHSKNLKDAGAVQEILSDVIARELHLKDIAAQNSDDD